MGEALRQIHAMSSPRSAKKTRVRGALITGKRCGVKIFWKDERKSWEESERKVETETQLRRQAGHDGREVGGEERKVWGKTSPQTVTSAQLCWSRLAAVAPAGHTRTHTHTHGWSWWPETRMLADPVQPEAEQLLQEEKRCRFSHGMSCLSDLFRERLWHGAFSNDLRRG